MGRREGGYHRLDSLVAFADIADAVTARMAPALSLEITGPLFMSDAVISNVQYRLTKVDGGTMIAFHHYAFGFIPDEYRQNINKSAGYQLQEDAALFFPGIHTELVRLALAASSATQL